MDKKSDATRARMVSLLAASAQERRATAVVLMMWR